MAHASACRRGLQPTTGVSAFSTGVGASMPRSPRRVRLVLARSQAPPENSPGRKPCGTGTETRQPRRGVRRLFTPGNRLFPVKWFFRPSDLYRTRPFPWLAPWATFWRPCGADAHENTGRNVETPVVGFSPRSVQRRTSVRRSPPARDNKPGAVTRSSKIRGQSYRLKDRRPAGLHDFAGLRLSGVLPPRGPALYQGSR